MQSCSFMAKRQLLPLLVLEHLPANQFDMEEEGILEINQEKQARIRMVLSLLKNWNITLLGRAVCTLPLYIFLKCTVSLNDR